MVSNEYIPVIVFVVFVVISIAFLSRLYKCYGTTQKLKAEREKTQEERRDIETNIRRSLSEGIDIRQENEDNRKRLADQIDKLRIKEVAEWKKIILVGIITASFFVLSVVLLIELILFSSIGQYRPFMFTLTETTVILIIVWIIYRIILSSTKITLKNNGVVLYFDIPDKQVGEGPIFAWFKDVRIPGTDIIISRIIEIERKEIVFDVHKDKTMLAVSADSTQPFWLDGYVTYRIKDIVQTIITTGEHSLDGIKDYFEGKEQEASVENEAGEKEKMNIRMGGIIDLTFRSFVRNFFREADNFGIKDGDTDEVVINKAIGVQEQLSKSLHSQFAYLKYFGIELMATEATDIKPSQEVENRLVKARTSAQDIGIATKEKDAAVETGKVGPELMNIFEKDANFVITPEIKSVIALLTINADALKGVLEGSNLNIALVPAINKLADAIGGGSPTSADTKDLVNKVLSEIRNDPQGIKAVVDQIKKAKML